MEYSSEFLYRATCFMFNAYQHPDKIFDYAKLYTVSVITSLLYGQRAVGLDSFWFKEFYNMMEDVRPRFRINRLFLGRLISKNSGP
jgi:hypothetical protein